MTGRRYGGAPAPRRTGPSGWNARRAQRPPGVLAWFDGTCWICDQPIQRHVHQITKRGEDWVHIHHAAGQDDE